MDHKALKAEWLKEESFAFEGWDFSHLKGRMIEDPLPWDYRSVILKHLRPEHKLLDMGTGGGEFLLTLKHPYRNTCVTEGYLPNVRLCVECLEPLGITVRQVLSDSAIPYEDASFDIILNRHESFDADEVFRLLKPNGCFITQQVGGENNRGLSERLIDGVAHQYSGHNLEYNKTLLAGAGFKIEYGAECFPSVKFTDMGALVFFAKIIEWEFPGFSVDTCFEKLLMLNDELMKQGFIESREHRFMISSKKNI